MKTTLISKLVIILLMTCSTAFAQSVIQTTRGDFYIKSIKGSIIEVWFRHTTTLIDCVEETVTWIIPAKSGTEKFTPDSGAAQVCRALNK